MCDIWNKQREKLEEALRKAALDLAEHTGCQGFSVLVPGTTPQLAITLAQANFPAALQGVSA